MLVAPWSILQLGVIIAGGLAGLLMCKAPAEVAGDIQAVPLTRGAGLACLAAFFVLLVVSFIPAPAGALALFDAFYRSGALVFGGGHVVLPLLRAAVVAPAWVPDGAFLAGYGAAQALPGPLFAFAAYLGAVATVPPGGIVGAVVALTAIFVPGGLCFLGALPFWRALRSDARARAAMLGTNAAVVGLIGAALYDPVWTSAVRSPIDFAIAASAFILLIAWRAPPLLVVTLSRAGWHGDKPLAGRVLHQVAGPAAILTLERDAIMAVRRDGRGRALRACVSRRPGWTGATGRRRPRRPASPFRPARMALRSAPPFRSSRPTRAPSARKPGRRPGRGLPPAGLPCRVSRCGA